MVKGDLQTTSKYYQCCSPQGGQDTSLPTSILLPLLGRYLPEQLCVPLIKLKIWSGAII